MKKLLALLLLMSLSTAALAVPPSDASIEELFQLSNIQKLIEVMRTNADKGMRQGMETTLGNRMLTDAQQKIADDFMTRAGAILDEQLTWEKVEPIYLQTYREQFTQEEVDAIIAFYRTPAGHALIEKMPAAAQRAALLMQPNMQVMMLKLRALQTDTEKQLKATSQ